MALVFCVCAGIILPFAAGVLLKNGSTLLSFLSMNAGVYFAVASVGMAANIVQ